MLIKFMLRNVYKFWAIVIMCTVALSTQAEANDVADGWIKVSPVIARAAYDSGVDVKLLAAMGAIESGFRPAAKASNTSAAGVFQFTARTWRVTLKQYGHKYGLSSNADVHDTYANAVMAAEYIKENVAVLEDGLERMPSYYEIYMAHFLSPLRAVRVSMSPETAIPAEMFPTIAQYNPSIFYKQDGTPRNVAEFRYLMHRKVNRALHIYGELANVALVKFKDGQVQLAKLSDMIGNFDTCNVPVRDIVEIHYVSYDPDSEVGSCPLQGRDVIGILNREEEQE